MWPILRLRDDLIERGGFFCDRRNPFTRFKGGTSVQQAPTHTQPWGQLEQALAGLVVPEMGGMELAEPEYYGGQRLAGISPYQTQGLGMAGGAPGAYEFAQGGMEDVLGNLSGGMQKFGGGIEDVFAPIYQQSQNLWNQEIAPDVMERFAGMGNAMSGGAASALAREGQNLSTNLGATLSPMWLQSQLADQQAMLQSQMALPGMLEQYAGMPGEGAQEMLGFGDYQRQLEQQKLDLAQQKWLEQQPYGSPYVSLGKDILSGGGANAMENIAKTKGDFLTSAAPGLGMGAMYLLGKSDKREKENFVPMQDTLEKIKALTAYTFNFKNRPDERRAGLIAQDVQAVLSEAVEERADGLYIRFDAIVGLLVNGVNEMAQRIEEIAPTLN